MHLITIYQKCFIIVALWHATAHAAGRNSHQHSNSTKKSRCLNPPRTARRVETFIQECQDEVKNKLISEAYQLMKDEMEKMHPTFDANDESVQFIPDELERYGPTAATADAAATPPPTSAAAEAASSEINYLYALRDELERAQVAHRTPSRRATRIVQHIRRITHVPTTSTTMVYHPTLVPYEDKRIAGCLLHCVYAKNNAIDKLGWPTLDGLVDFYSEGVNEHGFFMTTLRSVNLCLRAVTIKYRVNRRKLPEHGESCDLAFDVFDCISDQITGYCLDQYK